MSDTETTGNAWWDLSEESRKNYLETAQNMSFHEFMENNPDISEDIATEMYPDVDFTRPGDPLP
ncbi:hypothetical protein [Sphaerisporangium perillae]|uniref:hypothetical protein n=1 Tax=Sphaerisporangium perillae TaxID=2935860 RepID=UPI00200D20A9|nr:hypothetical protein [Sphaerisporangium perillae]